MAVDAAARQREKICLEPVTPALLDEVIARIVAAVDPDRIVLFGSHAKGTSHEYSDLDLFVVKTSVSHPLDIVEEIHGLFWDRAIELDVLVSSPDRIARELARGNSFLVEHILVPGKVIYGRAAA